MELRDFYERIEQHPELEGVGVEMGEECGKASVIVRHKPSQIMTRIPADAIAASDDWSLIADVLLGKREPVVLQQMTRVVGYFSRVENWNKSKVGELTDRKAGRYTVVEAEVEA